MPALGMTGRALRLVRQQSGSSSLPLPAADVSLLRNELGDVIVTELGDAIALEAG